MLPNFGDDSIWGAPVNPGVSLVAARARPAVGDGVFFVDLAPLADPRLVSETIAQAIGAEEPAARPTMDRLREYLAEKRLLLVMDNFEHVLGAAPAVNDLLAAGRQEWARAVALEVAHDHQPPTSRLNSPTNSPPPPAPRWSAGWGCRRRGESPIHGAATGNPR